MAYNIYNITKSTRFCPLSSEEVYCVPSCALAKVRPTEYHESTCSTDVKWQCSLGNKIFSAWIYPRE